jgi:ABC-2 type transport system permease protein
MWVRLHGLIMKEMLHTFRSPVMLFLIAWFYLIEAFLCTYALSFDVRNLSAAFVDLDRTAASRMVGDHLFTTDAFKRAASPSSAAAAEKLIQAGKVDIAVIVPHGFEASLGRAEPVEIQVLLNGVHSNAAAQARSYVFEILQAIKRRHTAGSALRSAGVVPIGRYWFNPGLSYDAFMVLSMLAIAATLTAVVLPAASVVREKELGTIEQLRVAPIRTAELFIAKMSPPMLIGLAAVFPSLLIAWWFDIPMRGSLSLFLGLTAIFLFSAMSIGVFIGAVSGTLQQALLLVFFALFPMLFLSGTMVPRESMPEALQFAAQISPLLYYFQIVLAVFMKGVGIEDLWPHVLRLLVFGSVLLLGAFLLFRRHWSGR